MEDFTDFLGFFFLDLDFAKLTHGDLKLKINERKKKLLVRPFDGYDVVSLTLSRRPFNNSNKRNTPPPHSPYV